MTRIQTRTPDPIPSASRTRLTELVGHAAKTLHGELERRVGQGSWDLDPSRVTGMATRIVQDCLGSRNPGPLPRRAELAREIRTRLDQELLTHLEASQRRLLEAMIDTSSRPGSSTPSSQTWTSTVPRGAAARLAGGLLEALSTLDDPRQRALLVSLFTGTRSLDEVGRFMNCDGVGEAVAGSLFRLASCLASQKLSGYEGWVHALKDHPRTPPARILRDASRGIPQGLAESWVRCAWALGHADPTAIARTTGLDEDRVETILEQAGSRPQWGPLGPFAVDRRGWARTLVATEIRGFLDDLHQDPGGGAGAGPQARSPRGSGRPDGLAGRWDTTSAPLKMTAFWAVTLFQALRSSSPRSTPAPAASPALPDRETLASALLAALDR